MLDALDPCPHHNRIDCQIEAGTDRVALEQVLFCGPHHIGQHLVGLRFIVEKTYSRP